MTRKRVVEVAAELKLDSKDVVRILREMGVPVRSHMSGVDATHVARLHARLERERRSDAPAATATQPRRRRRRRVKPATLTKPDGAAAVDTEEQPPDPTEQAAAETAPDDEPAVPPVEVAAAETAVAEDPSAAETEAAAAEVTTADDATVEKGAKAKKGRAAAVEGDAETAAPEKQVTAEETQVDEKAAAADAEAAQPDGADDGSAAEAAVADADASAEPAPAVEPDGPAAAEEPSGDGAASPAEPAAEPEAGGAPEPAGPRPVRPRPVRRGLPGRTTTPPAVSPAASAGPGGKVRISAEGYTVDGRRKQRGGERRKRRRVDRNAARQNVRRTMATMGQASPRKRRREAQAQQREAEQEQRELEKQVEDVTVRVNEFLTVSELADLITVPPQAIITSAFKNLGLMVTINQRLDFEQIELICEEAGYTAIREEGFEAEIALDEAGEEDDEGTLAPRPPVVTVMGHVDHGKTSLLDRIRSTNVIAGEAGGITQHIGAYHVELSGGRQITFLDTPGHEAFTAMRARGADLTDVVILVVAADDSVMPQTIEAISHAKNASVPLIVAVNKIDLPTADVGRVKQELLTHEVVLEEFGGDVLSADVSAKKGDGLDDLLEKVLLQAELLELKANPDRSANGTVVEAQLDRGKGPVATVLIERGTLRSGDSFVCGLHAGRVRALLDERGQTVTEAGPGIPVRVLGIEGVPQAGDSLAVVSAARAKDLVTRRQQLEREKEIRRKATGPRLEDVFEAVKAGERTRLNIVIKGDTDGSVQALSDSLERLSNEEVSVEVIHRGVGAINESDILLASTSGAIVIGFHVRPDAKAASVAERDSIEVRVYSVIYEAVEEVRMALEGLLAPEEREVTEGIAEIRELFRVPKAGTVAGCYVQTGTMRRNLPIRLLRDQVQIYEGRIDSLRRFKEDVREVRDGYECGISIENYNDIKVGDIIECYSVEEVARTLAEVSAS